MDKAARASAIELKGNHHFRVVLGAIESIRPLVPDYDPTTNNVEEIKFRSAQKQLHDLVMAILRPQGATT